MKVILSRPLQLLDEVGSLDELKSRFMQAYENAEETWPAKKGSLYLIKDDEYIYLYGLGKNHLTLVHYHLRRY